jgi:hypothetical protein
LIDQSIEQSINESIDQLVNQSIDQPIDQSFNHVLFDGAINRLIDQHKMGEEKRQMR